MRLNWFQFMPIDKSFLKESSASTCTNGSSEIKKTDHAAQLFEISRVSTQGSFLALSDSNLHISVTTTTTRVVLCRGEKDDILMKMNSILSLSPLLTFLLLVVLLRQNLKNGYDIAKLLVRIRL